MTAEAVLAAILLTSPPASVDEYGHHPEPRLLTLAHVVAADLFTIAFDAEVIDAREVATFWRDLRPYPGSECVLTSLQTRAETSRTWPVLAEAARLPPRPLIEARMAQNRTFRNWLVARQRIDLVHAEEIGAAVIECDRLYQVLDAQRDASVATNYVGCRRAALARLRDLVGAPAFYEASWPSHLPLR